jgi:hypothetical protein
MNGPRYMHLPGDPDMSRMASGFRRSLASPEVQARVNAMSKAQFNVFSTQAVRTFMSLRGFHVGPDFGSNVRSSIEVQSVELSNPADVLQYAIKMIDRGSALDY